MAISVRATLQDNAPGLVLELPAAAVEQLGAGKRPPVRVGIGEFRFDTRVAVYGGRFYLGLRKDQRIASGLEPGQSVEVQLELDTTRLKN
jgi:hypothetical protein